jgi:glyoxylate/hydroxypyruvate reductase A
LVWCTAPLFTDRADMLTILFASPKDWPEYETALPQALAQAGITAQIIHAPPPNAAEVDYIIYAPSSPLHPLDRRPHTRPSPGRQGQPPSSLP